MHKCALCVEIFDSWSLYQMHTEMHKLSANVTKLDFDKSRNLMGVKQPLSDKNKAVSVDKGEARMGKQHFYGGTI